MFFKKIIACLSIIAMLISFTLPVFAEEEQNISPYEGYFVYSVPQEHINNKNLEFLTDMPLDTVLELLVIKEKVLQTSTKLNFLYNRSSLSEDFSVTQFKTYAEQGYGFLENINAGETGEYITAMYQEYKTAYLSSASLTSGFTTFYSYAMSTTYYSELSDTLYLYSTEILQPILNEYCFSQATEKGISQSLYNNGDGKTLDLLINICQYNATKELPQSIKDLYVFLAEYFTKAQRGVYDKDILRLFEAEKTALKGRIDICEEINKYAEYEYFKEYCENFRYISTPVMAKGVKQEDVISIISKLAENALTYKENIEFKYEYYTLLCNIVYYQNDNYPELQVDADREAFMTRKNKIDAYYSDIYANYNDSIFSESLINTDIVALNHKIQTVYPIVGKEDVVKYTSSRISDGYAYNPIQISGDNMFLVYALLVVIVGALIIFFVAIVKVVARKIKDMPRIF